MRNRKRFLAFALVFLISIALIPTDVAADSDAIRIMVNGNPVNSDVATFVDGNDRTMVPVRFISEALNADVDWDAPTRTVTITRGGIDIILRIGSRELSKNGNITLMDTEAIIKDERTFVPVRFIAEALEMAVSWDPATRTVRLDGNDVQAFSTIIGYNGKIYSIYASPEIPNFMGIKGSEKFTPLPETIGEYLKSEGENMYVYSFAIYQDIIYYLAAEAGSDVRFGSIYECNLDGSENHPIINGVIMFDNCIIMDDFLYYYYENPTIEGASVNRYDLTGEGRWQDAYSDFSMYSEPGIVPYNGFYYYFLNGGLLYKKNIHTESESIILALASGPINAYGADVISVIYDTIYYVTYGEYGEYEDSGNTYLCGVSINGGTSEFLASWFTA